MKPTAKRAKNLTVERITTKWLREHDACSDAVKLFTKTFGGAADITAKNARRAAKCGLDLSWLAPLVLTPEAWADYEKATAPAWADYEKATAPARADYEKATDTARADYEKATATARADHQKATATAFIEAAGLEDSELKPNRKVSK